MLFPAKKGACSILNANEVHRARNEPKAIPARKEEIRNWGYSITNENKDFIRSLYLPLKLHGMSGSTRMMMMTHITIIPAATKKMNRHPKYTLLPLWNSPPVKYASDCIPFSGVSATLFSL